MKWTIGYVGAALLVCVLQINVTVGQETAVTLFEENKGEVSYVNGDKITIDDGVFILAPGVARNFGEGDIIYYLVDENMVIHQARRAASGKTPGTGTVQEKAVPETIRLEDGVWKN